MEALIDLFIHFDKHLAEFVQTYGVWVYGLLFVIIFAETGLVVTPFLPGDSLLFAAGALAATGAFNIWLLVPLLIVAAILGDAVNYAVGDSIGPRIFTSVDRTSLLQRMLNRDHLVRAHEFFERYGGKAIVLGRFVPIVRTFVPFVAGAGTMTYASFAFYNITGAIIWVGRLHDRRLSPSATSRSCATTSRWSRSVSSWCPSCPSPWSSSGTGAKRRAAARRANPAS